MTGIGRIAGLFALGACATALIAVPGAGAGDRSDGAADTAVVKGQAGGAAVYAASLNTLTITGKPVDGRINVFIGVTGRLTILSPEGVNSPAGVTQCTQDSPTQVSCDPGFIGAITAALLEGNDTFKASPGLPVIFGVVVNGRKQPLDGGPGRDRIVGAAGPDHLVGGSGPDNITGNGNGDLLEGNSGRDKLKGGAGKDFCNGGSGSDIGKSCTATKRIP
jgi:Ca2+-binding RTX toxin-like protein